MARLLLHAHSQKDDMYRLLVTAPTNKAITVLATRFLDSFRGENPFQPILVGDADKLLADNDGEKHHQTGKLKSIFLYSWMQSVIDDYQHIKSQFDSSPKHGHGSLRNLLRLAQNCQRRLEKQLGGEVLTDSILELVEGISSTLVSCLEFGGQAREISKDINALTRELKELPNETVYPRVRKHLCLHGVEFSLSYKSIFPRSC